ncbi:CPBP family intramembrane glutamic endopeptidase [Streptococcus pluranimalium]
MSRSRYYFSMIATVSIMLFHLLIPIILDEFLEFPGYYSDSYYLLYCFLFGVAILLASSLLRIHQDAVSIWRVPCGLKDWGIFMAILSGIAFFMILIFQFWGRDTGNSQAVNDLLYQSSGVYYPYLFLLLSCLLGPTLEELLYRGLLMTPFLNRQTYGLDMIASASLFSLIHLYQYPWSANAFVIYFVYGLGFAGIYRFSKNMRLAILAHVSVNTLLSMPYILYLLEV